MVPLVGLEPTHLAVPDFESGASTNFTTGAAGPDHNEPLLKIKGKIQNRGKTTIFRG